MTATPSGVLDSRLGTLESAEADGEVHADDAEAIRRFANAYNPENLRETPPGDDSTLKVGTVAEYVSRLTDAARGFHLTDADAEDVNDWLQSLKDNGKSDSYVGRHVTALAKFYELHGGPDREDMSRPDHNPSAEFDPEDVLTPREIHEMLDAAGNPRDRAVIALLAYTGMRNQALRTLRVSDVDVQNGTWSPNEAADGLKGMEARAREKRPLLGARGPVREWLKYHPASDDPDAYLITGRPKYGRANPDEPVAGSTVRRICHRVAENAGIESKPEDKPDDKPAHPHMFRHAFVTIAKREYDMADETIRFLIGHDAGSRVMETTYAHLSDEDYIERAEVAAGLRDPDDGDDGESFTPKVCDCGEPLAPDAKACPVCGTLHAPDAAAAQRTAQAIHDDATEAAVESTDPQEIAGAQALRDVTDPEGDAHDALMAEVQALREEVDRLKADAGED